MPEKYSLKFQLLECELIMFAQKVNILYFRFLTEYFRRFN